MTGRLVATRAPTATTAATPAVMSSTRTAMKLQAKVANWRTKDGSESGMPMRSAMDRTATTTPASAQTPAAMPARRVAVTRRSVRVVSGTRYAAWRSSPTVTAAARSWTTRA